MYISICGGSAQYICLAFFVTPTTVSHWGFGRDDVSARRLPIGLPPGQNLCASAWLTTTTAGEFILSLSVTSRPRRMGIFMVGKYPGRTARYTASGASPGRGMGLPSIKRDLVHKSPARGR